MYTILVTRDHDLLSSENNIITHYHVERSMHDWLHLCGSHDLVTSYHVVTTTYYVDLATYYCRANKEWLWRNIVFTIIK